MERAVVRTGRAQALVDQAWIPLWVGASLLVTFTQNVQTEMLPLISVAV